jgi:hypothetical protein
MRAAIIENGVVANVIEVDSLDVIPGLIDGANAAIGDQWDGSVLIKPAPPAPSVPESISPRQFRQALNHFGYRQQVEDAIAASTDQDLKDWYLYTSEFQRHHAQVLGMASVLGFVSEQLDAVWTYGAPL